MWTVAHTILPDYHRLCCEGIFHGSRAGFSKTHACFCLASGGSPESKAEQVSWVLEEVPFPYKAKRFERHFQFHHPMHTVAFGNGAHSLANLWGSVSCGLPWVLSRSFFLRGTAHWMCSDLRQRRHRFIRPRERFVVGLRQPCPWQKQQLPCKLTHCPIRSFHGGWNPSMPPAMIPPSREN